MRRRLVGSYLVLTAFCLLVLEIPLGVWYARDAHRNLLVRLERDAVAMASLAQGVVGAARPSSRAALQAVAERYLRTSGGRVLVTDRRGVPVIDSTPSGERSRSYASRPEIAEALRGRVASGERHSATLGTDLFYVAVPIAASGVVHGAARLTYPASALDAQVRRYWLVLGAVAALVLAAAAAVGWWMARSIALPLQRVRAAAAAVGAGARETRAPTDAGPPEVRELADVLNRTVSGLEDSMRAQDEFVADASHQLRTPLTALQLRLENLERDVPPSGSEDLEAALSEVGRLARLVDGLLALARADRSEAEARELTLSELVRERVEAWSPLAAEVGVGLACELDPRLAVRAGPSRLEQVLDNLIDNALEAAPERSRILISARREGREVRLAVADRGPGMSEADRARAFDRFWRGRDAAEGGTGLGLAIVQRLVRLDGGRTELVEAAGGGLEAVVRLPAVTSRAQADALEAADARAERGR